MSTPFLPEGWTSGYNLSKMLTERGYKVTDVISGSLKVKNESIGGFRKLMHLGGAVCVVL